MFPLKQKFCVFKKRNKLTVFAFVLPLLFLLFFFFSSPVLAQDSYQMLQPLPGVEPPTSEGGFMGYVVGMFNLLIGVAAVLAIIFIAIGGIQYITTDSISNKESGKQTINSAIFGLLLALASWLILYTINPNLVETFEIFNTA